MVLSNHILNYSAHSQSSGVVLHSKITIGYDVPWRKVHELLIDAAKKTEGVEAEPEPFVLQTSLDDFSVAYELNAHSRDPHKGAATTSRLHQNIQDNFNAAGIEIMSPHFTAVRDGGAAAIPDEHLPADYQPAPFRIHPLEDILSGAKR
jgi:small-conductance mechanosensitive channel